MRFKAWLACSKLALFPLSGTAGRTADSEYLFGVEFLFHGWEMMLQTEVWRMVYFDQLPKMSLLDFKLGQDPVAIATGLASAEVAERH
jgi:hypothetical protein